jgi:hypothetical protein
MLLRGVFDTLDEATYIDGADAYLQLLQVRPAAAYYERFAFAGSMLVLGPSSNWYCCTFIAASMVRAALCNDLQHAV